MITTMGRLYGEQHPASKLTSEQVKQIRMLWRRGHRNTRIIARNFGVSASNIRLIVEGKTWRHLLEENREDYLKMVFFNV